VVSASYSVRLATEADAAAVGKLYAGGDQTEIRARLAGLFPGTTHYLVELAGEPISVFSLTELGRVRPGADRRLLMHGMKLRLRFRGCGVPEAIFDWLSKSLGVGRDIELIALTPPEYRPPAIVPFGLCESHHAYKWAVSVQEAEL